MKIFSLANTTLLTGCLGLAAVAASSPVHKAALQSFVPEKLPLVLSQQSSLSVSPNEQTLALGGGAYADTVVLYDRQTRRTRILRLTGKMFSPPLKYLDPPLYYMSACSVQFSPNGRVLVNGGTAIDGAVGENSSLNLWDAHTGRHLALFGMGLVKGPAVVFSPNGKLIACSGQEMKTPRALFGRQIRFWNAATGKAAGVIPTPGPISALGFSPDSRRIVTGGVVPDPMVRVWDVRRSRIVWSHRLPGNLPLVTSVQFSPDGQLVATGSQEGITCLWNAKTGRLVGKLGKPQTFSPSDVARAVLFSPDGKRLVTAGINGVNVWSLPAGNLIQTLSASMPAAFLPDGKHIITADSSHSGANHALIWQIR